MATQVSTGSYATSTSADVLAGQYIVEIFGSPYYESWAQAYSFEVGYFPTIITDITDVDKNSTVSLYPNPTTGIVRIGNMNPLSSVTVLDMSGRLLKVFTPSQVIDLSSLVNGHYIIQFENTEGIPVHTRATLVH